MKTSFTLYLSLLLILSSAQLSATGVLQLSDSKQTSSSALLHPLAMSATANIHDQIVTTVVHERFEQTMFDTATVIYGFPMSATATVASMRLWINGVEYQTAISAAPVDTSHSSSNGGAVSTSAIQTFCNSYGFKQTAFQFPLAERVGLHSVIEIEFSTIELLNYSLGQSTYTFPLRTLLADTHVGVLAHKADFSLEINLQTEMPISKVSSTSHPAIVFPITNNIVSSNISLTSTTSGSMISSDFVLQFSVDQTDVRSAFYSNKPGNEDGHFAFLLRPSMSTSQAKVIAKNFTFIVDVSGSMIGTKIQQAREAAEYCVTNLNPQDRFNVIAFSSSVGRFQSAPVSATTDNIAKAVSYIKALQANGGTDLQGAALAGLAQYTDTNTVNIIIFLTDGIADLDQSAVQQQNTKHVRICVFGVGSDVNSQQLSTLAALNNGLAQFISEAATTTEVISDFYNRVRNPLWRNVSMTVTPTTVYDALPAIMPDLNVGEQLCIAGRYKQSGPATIHIHAYADGVEVNNDYPVNFSGDSTSDVFCPKIWARMRIDYLLQLMVKEGSQTARWTEWRNEVIRLGIRYGLVTDFTSYKDTGTVSDVEFDATNTVSVEAYPNPTTQTTTISFNVEEQQKVSIVIYDVNGQEVIRLLTMTDLMGMQHVQWDIRDAAGRQVPAGTYLCIVRIGSKVQLLKLTVL